MNRRPLALAAAATLLAAAPLSLAASKPKPVTFRTVELANQKAYGEPSIAISKDGKHTVVCVPGGAGETSIWYSGNDGRSWGTSHTNSDNGGGDCEIDFLPNGTLINADLEVTDSAIRYSKDFGKTWQGTQTAGIEQDRQWFAHSADGKTAYLVYHDFAAEAEFYAQSNDGGLTWPRELAAQPVTNIDEVALPGAGPNQPASLIDEGVNTFSGPMLISPDGKDTYVLYGISEARRNAATPPFGAPSSIVVAHKGPEATSFTNNTAVAAEGDVVNLTSFPSGAIDKAGNLYVIYTSDKGSPGHFHTYFIVSKDHAAHWSKPVKVDDVPLGAGAQVFATGAAGAPGVLDIAWYGTDKGNAGDKNATWRVHFAQVRGATTAHPSITRALVSTRPNHHGSIGLNGLLGQLEGEDRSLADFFELAIGPDGMAQIAYADNALPSDVDGKKGHVRWAKQMGGRSAWER